MTTLTTILGMIPFAIGTGQGSEMWRALGIAIIGGMTFSTIITLILIPAIYSRWRVTVCVANVNTVKWLW